MEFSLMTFNLRTDGANDGDNAWRNRVPHVVRTIERSSALIVSTQEGLHRMLSDLIRHLPHYSYVGQGRLGGAEDEFCAILYNNQLLSVEESGDFWLSETPSLPGSKSWSTSYPRMCTWARFQFRLEPATQFMVYNTHLDHRSQDAREQAIRLIWRTIDERHHASRVPFFLTGDLNAKPENEVIRFLRARPEMTDAFSALPEGPSSAGLTCHGFQGGAAGEPIDYIFGSRSISFLHSTIERGLLDGRYPSDHYPVVCRVTL